MVGSLDPRYEKRVGGCCTLQAQYERRSVVGGGRGLYERALYN